MTPDEKLFNALGRLHPLLRILFGVWLGISILFVAVDDLRQNLPLWLIIFLATPWVAISTYLALSMNWRVSARLAPPFAPLSPQPSPIPPINIGRVRYRTPR